MRFHFTFMFKWSNCCWRCTTGTVVIQRWLKIPKTCKIQPPLDFKLHSGQQSSERRGHQHEGCKCNLFSNSHTISHFTDLPILWYCQDLSPPYLSHPGTHPTRFFLSCIINLWEDHHAPFHSCISPAPSTPAWAHAQPLTPTAECHLHPLPPLLHLL